MAHDGQQVGGPGDIVEVDESHLFNKKYGRGRNLKRAIWVCGGISRVTKKAFIITIRDKKRNTLFPLMQRYIARGSFIMTDEHKSYSQQRSCHLYIGCNFGSGSVSAEYLKESEA